MATRVTFAIPEREIGNTGITFRRAWETVGSHGELTVRQNHLVWRPKGNEYVFELTWEKLATYAEQHGKRKKPKAGNVNAKKKLNAAG